MPPKSQITVPVSGRGELTEHEWAQVNTFLAKWQADVLADAKSHAPRAFQDGKRQVEAFVRLLGDVGTVQPAAVGGILTGPSTPEAMRWVERYAYHELDTQVAEYVNRIKDEILYGLRGIVSPVAVASRLYKATGDAEVNWRTIARTEMVRAQAAGRLAASKAMGFDRVWAPPHAGSCKTCKRVLEGKVFLISEVEGVSNFGKPQHEWRACCPMHPHCRHCWLPYDEEVYEESMRQHRALEQMGLTDDDTLDAIFDESGQLRPEARDAYDWSALKQLRDDSPDVLKTADRTTVLLGLAVEKARDGRGRYAGVQILHLPIDELRTDFYQRAVDPLKVAGMADVLRAGGDLPPALVSARKDGTRWLLGGQHRVAAARLAGGDDYPCRVLTGLTLDEEIRAYERDNPAVVSKSWQDELGTDQPTPGLMYHVARRADRASIDRDGLSGHDEHARARDAEASQPAGNYLFESRRAARRYCVDRGRADEDLWTVDTRGLNLNLDPDVEGGHYVTEAIAPDRLSLGDVAKGYFDPPQASLDPLLWDGDHLLPGVRERVFLWANRTLGKDWRAWAHLYLAGGAASRQWASPAHAEPDPDVDVQVLVDFPALRAARKTWRTLSDYDLHFALVALVKAGLADDPELVPGLRLDAFVRPEVTVDQFEAAARRSGQAVYHIGGRRWVAREHTGTGETWGQPWLEGTGAAVAEAHPDWIADAVAAVELLQDALTRYEADPKRANRRELEQLYRVLHDARAGAPFGNESKGNFIWQYAVNFGPLMHVKHLLHDVAIGKVWPDATVDVAKTGPLFPGGGLKEISHGSTTPHNSWDSAARSLAAHHQAGNKNVRIKALPHRGRSTERDLHDYEHKHLVGLAARHVVGKRVDDLDVAKAVSPNAGVEHWITVHPHGDDAPGQPVLVRNNSDGSMSVIGGAGGSLNYLRLDPKRRVDRKDGADKGKGEQLHADQPISEEEQAQKEAEYEQLRQQHQAFIEKTEGHKQAAQQALDDYIGQHLIAAKEIHHADGTVERFDWSELGPRERQKLLKKLRNSSLHTLAYGQLSLKDTQDGPAIITERHGDFEGMADGEKKDAEPKPDPESDDVDVDVPDGPKERKASLQPMTAEQAEEFMRLHVELARIKRAQSKSRALLRGQGKPSDAMSLEWTDADQGEVDRAVKEQVRQKQRTDTARSLLDTAEQHTYKKTKERATQRGAFDTIDAFTSAVLGSSAIDADTARLLGPAGAAQLAVHGIRKRAAEGGISMQKVLDSLEALTQKQEQEVATRALGRARKSADTAVLAREERKLSEAGESLGTQTMWRSYEQQKMNEAANALGMAIGGFEAASALKVAIATPAPKLKIGGFESPSQIKELAAKARIKVTAADVSRQGAGAYSLAIEPERLEHLFGQKEQPNAKLRQKLQNIRTGHGLAEQIEKQRTGPGMDDQLSPAQAQGKMFLLASTGEGPAHWNLTGTPVEKSIEDLRALKALGQTIAFAPGVGKTHTGIAAAMQKMHDEPEAGHKVLVVAPTTALATWANTVSKQGPGHSVQIIGSNYGYDEQLGNATPSGPGRSGKRKRDQYDTPADFNVISFESLAKDPELAKKLGATIVITDEAQKAKNANAGNWQGLKEVGDAAGVKRPTVESKTAFKERYGRVGQDDHITREDKVRQFRESMDEHLFQLSAADAGNDLPGVVKAPGGDDHHRHKVELDPEHKDSLKKVVAYLNEERDKKREGESYNEKALAFGGRQLLQAAVYSRPNNAMARKVGDLVDKMKPVAFRGMKTDHPDGAYKKGDHAGSYEQKSIVFSQFVGQLEHVKNELEGRGHKVFYAHGGLSNNQNDKVLRDYLAHPGKAVLVTSDKNSTARSLQFGDNSGKFQHGATQLIHYSLPDNNATIEQREARQHRRGAQLPVTQHIIDAGTPAEMRQQDRLASEKRTQDLAGTSEQLVAGNETLRHILARKGQRPPAPKPEAAAA